MAVIGRRVVTIQHTLVGPCQTVQLEFRCLTCGAQLHADESNVLDHGYTAGGNPYILTFCSCEPDLFVPVTMIEGAP